MEDIYPLFFSASTIQSSIKAVLQQSILSLKAWYLAINWQFSSWICRLLAMQISLAGVGVLKKEMKIGMQLKSSE